MIGLPYITSGETCDPHQSAVVDGFCTTVGLCDSSQSPIVDELHSGRVISVSETRRPYSSERERQSPWMRRTCILESRRRCPCSSLTDPSLLGRPDHDGSSNQASLLRGNSEAQEVNHCDFQRQRSSQNSAEDDQKRTRVELELGSSRAHDIWRSMGRTTIGIKRQISKGGERRGPIGGYFLQTI